MSTQKIIIIFFISLLIILAGFSLFSHFQKNNFIFAYPEKNEINFAGEVIPQDDEHFFVIEKFDKEFLINTSNLYQFYLYAKRYPLYVPYIEKKLAIAGIPDDFKYLPIAESALKIDISSSAGAASIWQFMPETAKRYGLIINEYVDERYHFEKSTDAAIAYIQDLYKQFGNRTLSATAYNRGENGLINDMKDQNAPSFYDLSLNIESGTYIYRILAIKYMFLSYFPQKDFVDTFIGGVYTVPKMEEQVVEKIDDIKIWAKEHGHNLQAFKKLNPWILGNSLPSGEWKVKVILK